MHGFMAAAMKSNFFPSECFRNQSIFIMGGADVLRKNNDGKSIYDVEYLCSYALQHGARHCERGVLPYENVLGIEQGEYRGDFTGLREYYAGQSFERVIVLSGLEYSANPLHAFKQLYSLLKKGGQLDLFVRTPRTNYVKYSINEYEHRWRFSLEDIESIFCRDIVQNIVVEESGDFYAIELEKATDDDYISDKHPVFSIYEQAYILPENLKAKGYFARYTELDEIGSQMKTDKNRYEHNYLNKYEFFLKPWRDKEFSLLELGIFLGGSARMWERYFSKAAIHCVDIMPECVQLGTERIKPYIMDLGDANNVRKLRDIKPDIIIDDASHWWRHQILALFTLFSALPHGGIYILEDLETSVNRNIYQGCDDGSPIDAYTVCERIAKVTASKFPEQVADKWSEKINEIGMAAEMVAIIRGSCIIVKR